MEYLYDFILQDWPLLESVYNMAYFFNNWFIFIRPWISLRSVRTVIYATKSEGGNEKDCPSLVGIL